mmetsp:Transcript_2807/g.9080  ORF Transcript_2807/g.9080 Transcript_2807/m.9080 type:complete len:301 (-) Transcript_2807:3380-4282(-)
MAFLGPRRAVGAARPPRRPALRRPPSSESESESESSESPSLMLSRSSESSSRSESPYPPAPSSSSSPSTRMTTRPSSSMRTSSSTPARRFARSFTPRPSHESPSSSSPSSLRPSFPPRRFFAPSTLSDDSTSTGSSSSSPPSRSVRTARRPLVARPSASSRAARPAARFRASRSLFLRMFVRRRSDNSAPSITVIDTTLSVTMSWLSRAPAARLDAPANEVKAVSTTGAENRFIRRRMKSLSSRRIPPALLRPRTTQRATPSAMSGRHVSAVPGNAVIAYLRKPRAALATSAACEDSSDA